MKINIVFIAFWALVGCQNAKGDYSAKHIQDGDSLIVCCENEKNFTVRLKDIDAPEKKQPYAKEAKKYLTTLLKDKKFILIGSEKDRYGRRLVDIQVEGQSVNQQMIKAGAAWVWKYSDNLKLQWLQKKAKKDGMGLWSLPKEQRIEPWVWREKYPRRSKGR